MHYIDRNGHRVYEKDVSTGVLAMLYKFAAGRMVLKGLICPGLSDSVGKFLNTRLSGLLNAPYIRRHHIDMQLYEAGPYRSFNELFHRRVLPEARPVDTTPGAITSPCDGRMQIFHIDGEAQFEIKGIPYTMEQLLRDSALAERYRDGTLMLFRLGVGDYHRYAYPVDGKPGKQVHLDGVLHTVTPMKKVKSPIYCENIREYTLLETTDFGTVLMMEVGALLVGHIVNHPGRTEIHRGEEKGFFEFGASSILLCFEKGTIAADEDILRNTADRYETLVQLGEHIGQAAKR